MGKRELTVIPYLTFRGDCEQALSAYIQALGGEIRYLSRWSADAAGSSTGLIGKVMHAEFTLGNTPMAAGDSLDGTGIQTDVRLMVHRDTQEQAVRTIAVLAQGGAVLSPLKPHPKPDDAGCGCALRDRFGYTWIITCPNPDKPND